MHRRFEARFEARPSRKPGLGDDPMIVPVMDVVKAPGRGVASVDVDVSQQMTEVMASVSMVMGTRLMPKCSGKRISGRGDDESGADERIRSSFHTHHPGLLMMLGK
jgi:hypothetical protein